jgi:ferredoxin
MKRLLMRLWREETAQILPLTVLCLVVLMGFMALAIDVGQMQYTQRQMQSLADAATLAGANEISQCGGVGRCAAMVNAATSAVAEAGQASATIVQQCATISTTGVTVALNNGPCALGASDPNNGNISFVETVATMQMPTFFAGVFGFTKVAVSARSEAGPSTTSQNCAYATGPSGTTVTINSGATLSGNCGLSVASNGTPAVMVNGAISTTSTSVDGTVTINGGGSVSPAASTGVAQPGDPLTSLATPSVPGTSQSIGPYSGTTTLNPGYYNGTVNFNGSGYTVTLNPGLYYFNGSVNVPAITLQGSGVTLYFASGSLQLNSNAVFSASAPTSGTYAGILYFEGRSNSTSLTIDSGTGSKWQGVVYLPDAGITLNSSANAAAYTFVIAQSLMINSSFALGDDYSSLPGGSPIAGSASGAIAMQE